MAGGGRGCDHTHTPWESVPPWPRRVPSRVPLLPGLLPKAGSRRGGQSFILQSSKDGAGTAPPGSLFSWGKCFGFFSSKPLLSHLLPSHHLRNLAPSSP